MIPRNPLMAALLAASSAAFALPGFSFAEETTQPINAIAAHIQDPNSEARKDVGERFSRLVQEKVDPSMRESAAAEARAWARTAPAGTVAELYFVMGPDGTPPGWAQDDPQLANFKAGMSFSSRLDAALEGKGLGKIASTQGADGVPAFFNVASGEAHAILNAMPKEAVGASIQQNEADPAVFAMRFTRGATLPAGASGSGAEDLYVKDAETADLSAEGDLKNKDSKFVGYRTLSAKLYTVRQKDGTAQTMVGIVDVTRDADGKFMGDTLKAPIYFPIGADAGKKTFSLYPGGRPYEITMSGGKIKIQRDGAKEGDPALETSVEQLAVKRIEGVMSKGTVRIGKRFFYVYGQGGENGSVLFFPTELIEQYKSGKIKDTRYLRPEAMATASEVDKDGLTVPVKGKPSLDKIDGTSYHMEYDHDLKIWRVVQGDGDPLAKPEDKDKKDKGDEDGASASSDQSTKSGDSEAGVDSKDELADWTVEKANKGFDAETKKTVQIDKNDKGPYVILPRGTLPQGTDFQFGQSQRPLYGSGKFVIFKRDKTQDYFSISDLVAIANGKTPSSNTYSEDKEKKIKSLSATDLDAAIQILKDHFTDVDGVGSSLYTAVRERVKKHAKDGQAYTVTGNPNDPEVGGIQIGFELKAQGTNGCRIWPDDACAGGQFGAFVADNSKGPGTFYGLSGSAPDAGDGKSGSFKSPISVENGKSEIKVVKSAASAAMYSGSWKDKSDKDQTYYYLRFDWGSNAEPKRTAPIYVFGGDERPALPGTVEIQGLNGKDQDIPAQGTMVPVIGGSDARGVYAVYRYAIPAGGNLNIKDPVQNCAGPVMWWGMSKEQALAACRAGIIQ